MKAQTPLRSSQTGMVSMITVILLSLILTVITTGYLRIIARNQHDATNAQLSTQAFYAAETGVEDGKRAIETYLTNPANVELDPVSADAVPTDCGAARTLGADTDIPAGANTLDAQASISYPCQLIDLTPSTLVADRDAFGAVTFPLQPKTGGFDTIQVSWSQLSSDSARSPWAVSSEDKLLAASSLLAGTQMPMLRVELATVTKDGANLTRDQFYRNERSYFLAPIRSNPSSDPNLVVKFCPFTGAASSCSNDTQFNTGPKAAECSLAGFTQVCTMTLHLKAPSGGSTTGSIADAAQVLDGGFVTRLRLQPLYHGAHLEVQVKNGANPVQIANTQASIDVTGRANDVYKRIRVHLPLIATSNLPLYSTQTSENICKLWNLTSSTTALDGQCLNDN